MKSFILAFSILSCPLLAAAQEEYKAPLQAAFTTFDTTQNELLRTDQGNRIVLIAKKYPNEWATNYYAAYSRVQISYYERDEAKRDAYVDEAEGYYEEAVRLLGKETDETHVLAAMIAQGRLSIKPQQRYQKFGKIFEDHLEAAKALNPDNPRIYYLRGTSKFYTPKMFGGGKKAALPYFQKAEGLYAKQGASDIGTISWGKIQNDYFLSQASGDDDK